MLDLSVAGNKDSTALRRALDSIASSLKRANVGEFWVAWKSENDFFSDILYGCKRGDNVCN